MRSYRHWILIFTVLITLSACGEPVETPDGLNSAGVEETAVSTAIIQEPTTIELEVVDEEVATPIIEATLIDAVPSLPPPTIAQAVTAEPPSPPPTKRFEITQLSPQLSTGETAVVAGTSPNLGEAVTVELVAGRHMLAQGSTEVNEKGDWEFSFAVPFPVTGAGLVRVISGVETAVQPVQLISGGSDPLGIKINGVQPGPDSVAVAGAHLFFAGDITHAINQTITIGFWVNDCTESVARQSFTLKDAFASWNGTIILPRNIAAEQGCASISTGDPAGTWREQIIPVKVIQLEDEAAKGLITIGNRFVVAPKAGTSLLLFGSALNLPAPVIEIVGLEEDGHQVTPSTTAAVDGFGYWEATIQLPAEVTGTLNLSLSSGRDEHVVSTTIPLVVNP